MYSKTVIKLRSSFLLLSVYGLAPGAAWLVGGAWLVAVYFALLSITLYLWGWQLGRLHGRLDILQIEIPPGKLIAPLELTWRGKVLYTAYAQPFFFAPGLCTEELQQDKVPYMNFSLVLTAATAALQKAPTKRELTQKQRQEKIIEYKRVNPDITYARLAELLEVTEITIKRDMHELKANDTLS